MNKQLLEDLQSYLSHTDKLLREQIRRLSWREKMLVAGALIFLAAAAGYLVYEPVQEAFASQSKRLQEVSQEMENVAIALGRYMKLKARQSGIEQMYKEVEITEGVRSLLSSIVESKAGIPAGQYEINEREPRAFGVDYEQTPFRVRFIITDYQRLVNFLGEIVNGAKPLILISLDIRKRPTSDGSLEVELEVSSIRRINR